jgi:hypothetical protein
MKKREINIQTGEETVIDLTAEEVSAKEAREVEHQTKLDAKAAAKTTSDAKKASGKQKLKDLGLDDDEIKALTGA